MGGKSSNLSSLHGGAGRKGAKSIKCEYKSNETINECESVVNDCEESDSKINDSKIKNSKISCEYVPKIIKEDNKSNENKDFENNFSERTECNSKFNECKESESCESDNIEEFYKLSKDNYTRNFIRTNINFNSSNSTNTFLNYTSQNNKTKNLCLSSFDTNTLSINSINTTTSTQFTSTQIPSTTSKQFTSPNSKQIPSITSKQYHINKKYILYKTEICRSHSETGFCKYGNKCQFAHDLSELRNVNRHPRYKTETCKTFWEEGSCPYGTRCCFIHVKNENNKTLNEVICDDKRQENSIEIINLINKPISIINNREDIEGSKRSAFNGKDIAIERNRSEFTKDNMLNRIDLENYKDNTKNTMFPTDNIFKKDTMFNNIDTNNIKDIYKDNSNRENLLRTKLIKYNSDLLIEFNDEITKSKFINQTSKHPTINFFDENIQILDEDEIQFKNISVTSSDRILERSLKDKSCVNKSVKTEYIYNTDAKKEIKCIDRSLNEIIQREQNFKNGKESLRFSRDLDKCIKVLEKSKDNAKEGLKYLNLFSQDNLPTKYKNSSSMLSDEEILIRTLFIYDPYPFKKTNDAYKWTQKPLCYVNFGNM